MNELLSLWRSPIDRLALASAEQMAARQPRGDYTIDQLPPLVAPDPNDLVAIWHNASGKTMSARAGSFGGGTVSPIAFNTSFAPLTIYNYGNYINTPGLPNAANTAALAAMFADMASTALGKLVGGYAWIPQYQFVVNATGLGLMVPDQSVIQGLGNGGSGSAQFLITGTTGAGDIFFNTGPQTHSEGGIYFRNLSFQWTNPLVVGDATHNPDTALNLETWGAKAQDCVFIDCPTAVSFSELTHTGLGCTMERCVVRYGIHATCPNNAVQVIMSGEQGQIIGGIFNQNPFISGGPNGVTGLGWGGGVRGSEHQIVSGVHFADFQWGIDFSNRRGLNQLTGGAVTFTLRDCQLDNYSTCLNLSNDVTNANIIGGTIEGNVFNKSRQSQNDSNPIVLIDTLNEIGGGNSNISFIDFIANEIYSNVTSSGSANGIAADNQYGLEIRGGSGLNFYGGKIGQVGNNATNTGGVWNDQSANVCIAGGTLGGGPGNVTFTTVVLGPKYGTGIFGGGPTGAGQSQYGVLIKGNFVNGPVIFNGCQLQGFTGTNQAALHVAGGATVGTGSLFFNNCPGYNDQNTNIIAGGTVGTTAFKAATASAAAGSGGIGGTVNYYGPSLFTAISGGGTLSINGGSTQAIPLGAFICVPVGPYETLQFSVAPTNPLWRGK